MATHNPTLKARYWEALSGVLQAPEPLALAGSFQIGPFENRDLVGLFSGYPPEDEIDLGATYPGKMGQVRWQRAPDLDGLHTDPLEVATDVPSGGEDTYYYYAEVQVQDRSLAYLRLYSSGFAHAWVNGSLLVAPTIPEPANPNDYAAWVVLEPGVNRVLVKMMFMRRSEARLAVSIESYGLFGPAVDAVRGLAQGAEDPAIRLTTLITLAEIMGVAGETTLCRDTLAAVRFDEYATRWDAAWAEAVEQQFSETGHFTPFHDVRVKYSPVTSVQPYEEFWPQSSAPASELLVVDVSEASPQVEFALSVLQGLVNRSQPRLYLLHTRYRRQDTQWLDELHFEGFTSRQLSIEEAWRLFKGEIKGAVIYDGAIMEEIGAVYSDQLNQTNLLMMIGALEDSVPLTPEMNAALGLPVVFDARGKWSGQYDMMRWAYVELFPRMNPRILATDYPGIFLITDYLVAHRIFTFWFPQYRTIPEENLLCGILASTPPNSPILGWWFDWMPNPKEQRRDADAVMEWPGLLRGSYFGKILTPSHEATNLTVHSGVKPGGYQHKLPERPAFDPSKIYYTFMISDGDNLGEALMMRTRDLQWDKPERGTFPMGWSFAPATSRLASPVLSYYLRTASPNDVLMGGLGVGYTEPIIYLRAYPVQREELWAQYARDTDRAVGWIDSTLLWLINGRHEEADRYARGSSGQLKGIFIGYGGEPEIAEARITHNQVVAFYSATRFHGEKLSREEKIQALVDEIRLGVRSRPDFIEAWVLNWGLEMSILQEVQARLGPDYVCVRPDVLVDLRLEAENTGSGTV